MKKKVLICALIFTLSLSILVSCGAKASDLAVRDEMEIGNMMSGSFAPATDTAYGYDDYYYDAGSKKYAETEIVIDSTGANNGNYSEKIIKNVSINAQTKEYEKALDGILAAVVQHGGYEESVTSSGKSYYSSDYYTRNARMTLRIPAENLDKFLGEVGGLINVISQSSSQSNVTAQYYDTVARLEVLESERLAYEEMLKLAKEVSEVLEIKDRLYQTIAEIEANKTQIKVYDNKVSFSTVTIQLEEVREYVETPTTKITFGERIARSFKNSWRNFADGFQDFVVWFVGAIPTFLVLAVIFGGVAVIVATLIKKHKKKHNNDK